MKYSYVCNKCGKEETVECKMSEYKSEFPCDCNGTMKRKPSDLVCGDYIVNCQGFYGKSSK